MLLEFLYTRGQQEDIGRMQTKSIHERRVIFRPYSQNGSGSNIFICTGCGMQFTQNDDMGEMAMRFAEHLCEPIMVSSSDSALPIWTH